MTETNFPGDITEEEFFEEIFETQWMVEEDNFRYLLDGLDKSDLQSHRLKSPRMFTPVPLSWRIRSFRSSITTCLLQKSLRVIRSLGGILDSCLPTIEQLPTSPCTRELSCQPSLLERKVVPCYKRIRRVLRPVGRIKNISHKETNASSSNPYTHP